MQPGEIWERLRAGWRRDEYDRDLAGELAAHAALLEEEYVKQGQTPEEARRQARLALGSPGALREAHEEVRSLAWLDNLRRDARYAVRSLWRDRGFAFFTLAIGALGIGAGTAIFSAVNTLLLRPLPVSEPQSLVWVAKQYEGVEGDLSSSTAPVNAFVEYRNENRSFSGMTAYFAFYQPLDRRLQGDHGPPERFTAVPVADNFFRLLGVKAVRGREFTSDECRANLPVVILAERFWKRRFQSDPAIVGRRLAINDVFVTVVGVMPIEFGGMLAPGTTVDMFTPLPLTEAINRFGNTLSMIGRLRPGVTIAQAQAEANSLTGPIGLRNNRADLRFTMRSLDSHVRGKARPAVMLLGAGALLVLLVLCANVSHLQLARAAARTREMSIRVALGAAWGRLAQQLITESVLLFGAATALGLVLAVALTRWFASLEAIHLPLRGSIQVDLSTFAFAAAAAALTGLICGLAPALQFLTGAQEGLKESGRSVSASRRQGRLRRSLVLTEIALASVLLVGAGLLVRSFQRVLNAPLGFQPAQAAALRIDPAGPRGPARSAYFDEILARVRALPGIAAAGVTDVIPLTGNRSWGAGAKEKTYSERNPPPSVFVRVVSDGYLSALGIAIKAGRDIDARDRETTAPVLVINESLARALWPGEDAVGKFVKYVGRTDRQVVGVVADVRHIGAEQSGGNEIYLPIRQTTDYGALHLVFRSTVTPESAVRAIRETLRPWEPNLPVNSHQLLADLAERSSSPRRLTMELLTSFALFTLVLAAVGIFGLISYSVTQRTQEIGVRLALGATGAQIRGAILRETMGLTAGGLAIGLVISLVLARGLKAMLYEVEAADPLTLAAVCLIVLGAGLMSAMAPAVRAARIDPLTSLRSAV